MYLLLLKVNRTFLEPLKCRQYWNIVIHIGPFYLGKDNSYVKSIFYKEYVEKAASKYEHSIPKSIEIPYLHFLGSFSGMGGARHSIFNNRPYLVPKSIALKFHGNRSTKVIVQKSMFLQTNSNGRPITSYFNTKMQNKCSKQSLGMHVTIFFFTEEQFFLNIIARVVNSFLLHPSSHIIKLFICGKTLHLVDQWKAMMLSMDPI